MHLMRIEMHDARAVGQTVSPASYNLLIYVRVPDSWLDGEQINDQGKEKILAHLYGPNWRSGNEDGSSVGQVSTCRLRFDDQATKTAG